MPHTRLGPRWLLLLTLPIIVGLMTIPATAQSTDRPCAAANAPADGFQSRGIGLTGSELEAMYGPGEARQGAIIYDWNGVELHQDGCDLILDFPPEVAERQMHEFALAESLLPADAVYAGSFARGTGAKPEAAMSLWRSASLAKRFAQMGEHRGGEVLIVYTYQAQGSQPGQIQHIALRTLELPA